MYYLWPDTRVISGKMSQEEYETERLSYVKKFVTTCIRDMSISEGQILEMIKDCLDGDYSGDSL